MMNSSSTLMKNVRKYLGFAIKPVMKEQGGARTERSIEKNENVRWEVKISGPVVQWES